MNHYNSPLISSTHAFFTRKGGISPAPFHSLNFGGSDDSKENVAENRRRALTSIGLDPSNVARLDQVHGNKICLAKNGSQEGDALVTIEKGITLAIGAADCYPLLFEDPIHKIIGAAHCGWKGTLARIAGNTIEEMEKLGAKREQIRVAIGPGISGMNYEVSEEVIGKFLDAGFPASIHEGRKLDLLAANRFVLRESGISEQHIWALGRCTTGDEFFSYRRDNGKTGRMWAVISMRQ